MDEAAETGVYTVLVNPEKQHSVWRWGMAPPLGWRATGQVGTKAQCSRYVDEMCTDIRPTSTSAQRI